MTINGLEMIRSCWTLGIEIGGGLVYADEPACAGGKHRGYRRAVLSRDRMQQLERQSDIRIGCATARLLGTAPAEILARVEPGDRPAAWWEYDAPVPRDRTIPEALQLFRLGQLAGGELARVIAIWRKYEKTALGLLKKHGKRDYHQFRRWAGIPDEVVPPAVSTAI